MAERVVFDTNVWISGLLWRGKPYECLLLAKASVIHAVYCDETLEELTRKLQGVFGFAPDRLQAVENEVRKTAMRVEIKGDLHVVSRDPDDDKFVECAVVADADIIVSGDRHLLDLRVIQGVRVLTPAQFLKDLGESGEALKTPSPPVPA